MREEKPGASFVRFEEDKKMVEGRLSQAMVIKKPSYTVAGEFNQDQFVEFAGKELEEYVNKKNEAGKEVFEFIFVLDLELNSI